MKKLFLDYWVFLLLAVFVAIISWPLFQRGYFSHHDDLQVMRIYEMRRCLTDLQIPCRWVPDMGYGNGFPLFNYYSALPYYIGALFSFLVGYIWAAKILFFIPLALGGISIFLLGKELFGKIAGIVVAGLFLLAPYRALELYVRGAVAESFGLAIVPLVFYFILKLIRQATLKNFLGVSISLAAFLISHNIMTLFFVPIIFLWSVYFLYLERPKKAWLLFISLALGFGLASFFILPAFFEKLLVQSEALKSMDLNYRANYVSLNQIFLDRHWGYGTMINDNISFQIGWPHWWLVAITIPLLGVGLVFRKLKFRQVRSALFLLVVFVASVFMTHNRSAFIWERISILEYAQFPWRFLSLIIFSASLIGGFLIALLKNNKQRYFLALVIICTTLLLNWSYFIPEKFYPNLTDQEKLSGRLWEDQQKAAILDYLPKTAYEPREKAPSNPMLISGNAEISAFSNYSNRWSFETTVKKPSTIELPVFDFPNWQVKVNGKNYPHSNQNYLGRISINLPEGMYKVEGYFHNTPIRTLANIVSLVSLCLLIIMSIYGKSKKIFI
ncbi:MAG: 6-pyruvoyl-tetrahydropterin synthase-related protein [Candidatus Daviesbacteria bacterium]|nr:6-pyruvoyl-tetrahydropterin synthase-related protein [Candidatus Daviesbacteria bacterium]